MKRSIKEKVNSIFLKLFIAAGVIITLFQFLLINSVIISSSRDTERLLDVLVKSEYDLLIKEIYESRMQSLKLRAEKIKQTEGVLAVLIYDFKGNLLLSLSGNDDVDLRLPEIFSDNYYCRDFQYAGVASVDYTMTLLRAGERIGFIRIIHSPDNILNFRLYALIISGLLAVVFISVPVILNRKLNRIIISPVMRLNEAIKKAEPHNSKYKFIDSSDDEIGELATSFSEMMDRIFTMLSDNDIIIDEFRVLNEAFRKSEEELRITLNSIADGVISADINGRIIRMNDAASLITGFSSKDLPGRDMRELFSFFDREEILRISDDSIVLGAVSAARRVTLRDKNNRDIPVSVSVSAIKNDLEEYAGTVVVFRDITEYILIEEKFRQSQKMDAVGQLAGGVAHDFNNMLSAIAGAAELMKISFDNLPELESYVDMILSTSLKASKLTQRLLSFSRQGNMKLEVTDVKGAVQSAVQLLKRCIDKRIIILTEFKDDELFCLFDNAHLENVILNIGINAKDAMTDGGILEFSAGIVELDHDFCHKSGFEASPGSFIEITCTDNGCGMTEELLEHIFEPFFTTKGPGKGTGLGLASVYGLIKDYNGIIKVSSTPGAGTIFSIYIPASCKKDEIIEEAYIQKRISPMTILLADDEMNVNEVLRKLIEKLGHTVISAYNGADAVDKYMHHWKEIDLVILDMMMPGLNGRDVFFSIADINPELKVLISSGYSKDDCLNELLIERNVCGFLQKPYSIDELSTAINDIFIETCNSQKQSDIVLNGYK